MRQSVSGDNNNFAHFNDLPIDLSFRAEHIWSLWSEQDSQSDCRFTR